jgi:hypothetical protein
LAVALTSSNPRMAGRRRHPLPMSRPCRTGNHEPSVRRRVQIADPARWDGEESIADRIRLGRGVKKLQPAARCPAASGTS